MIVYISIGNSDDKLTQAEWAAYVAEMLGGVVSLGHTHGAWYSLPHTPYQNACWCVEFAAGRQVLEAQESAIEIRKKYRQDSVAWAEAEVTVFL